MWAWGNQGSVVENLKLKIEQKAPDTVRAIFVFVQLIKDLLTQVSDVWVGASTLSFSVPQAALNDTLAELVTLGAVEIQCVASGVFRVRMKGVSLNDPATKLLNDFVTGLVGADRIELPKDKNTERDLLPFPLCGAIVGKLRGYSNSIKGLIATPDFRQIAITDTNSTSLCFAKIESDKTKFTDADVSKLLREITNERDDEAQKLLSVVGGDTCINIEDRQRLEDLRNVGCISHYARLILPSGVKVSYVCGIAVNRSMRFKYHTTVVDTNILPKDFVDSDSRLGICDDEKTMLELSKVTVFYNSVAAINSVGRYGNTYLYVLTKDSYKAVSQYLNGKIVKDVKVVPNKPVKANSAKTTLEFRVPRYSTSYAGWDRKPFPLTKEMLDDKSELTKAAVSVRGGMKLAGDTEVVMIYNSEYVDLSNHMSFSVDELQDVTRVLAAFGKNVVVLSHPRSAVTKRIEVIQSLGGAVKERLLSRFPDEHARAVLMGLRDPDKTCLYRYVGAAALRILFGYTTPYFSPFYKLPVTNTDDLALAIRIAMGCGQLQPDMKMRRIFGLNIQRTNELINSIRSKNYLVQTVPISRDYGSVVKEAHTSLVNALETVGRIACSNAGDIEQMRLQTVRHLAVIVMKVRALIQGSFTYGNFEFSEKKDSEDTIRSDAND